MTKGGLVRLAGGRTADAGPVVCGAVRAGSRRGPTVVTPSTRPAGAWTRPATGCGRSLPRRRRCTPSAPAAGSPTRPRCSAPTSRCVPGAGRMGGVSRSFEHAPHQTCLAHLLRRCKDLAPRPIIPTAPGPPPCRRSCSDALALRTRCNAGRHRRGTASRRPAAGSKPGSGRLIDAPPPLAPAERFARRPGPRIRSRVPLPARPVPRRHQLAGRTRHPTRGGHPQGLRPQPSARRGADTQQILASVVRTARQTSPARTPAPCSPRCFLILPPNPVVRRSPRPAAVGARLTAGRRGMSHASAPPGSRPRPTTPDRYPAEAAPTANVRPALRHLDAGPAATARPAPRPGCAAGAEDNARKKRCADGRVLDALPEHPACRFHTAEPVPPERQTVHGAASSGRNVPERPLHSPRGHWPNRSRSCAR